MREEIGNAADAVGEEGFRGNHDFILKFLECKGRHTVFGLSYVLVWGHKRAQLRAFKRDEGGKPNPMILFVFEILLSMVNPKHKVLSENFHSEPSYERRKVAC